MSVHGITKGTGTEIITSDRQKTDPEGFSRALKGSISESGNTGRELTGKTRLIELGQISKENPTVSHLLKSNPEYADKCWNIIFAAENRGKEYGKMQEGTVVALKTGSKELLWGKELQIAARAADAPSEEKSVTVHKNEKEDSSIVVGKISSNNPTVSHLFQANAQFSNDYWDIIHAGVNSSKKFTALRPGTLVSLNTNTMELSFADPSKRPSPSTVVNLDNNDKFEMITKNNHNSLADAVKPYIGRPYKEIDCYGLIVRGLSNQGFQYTGRGGIREQLETLAVRNGLPRNAYFSGEGLVEKAGTKVFSKAIHKISNTRKTTDEIYSEIAPHLKEGLILSFSTPTRGHTGIVSREGNDWTYINSGLIDNQVSPGRVTKRVGEEYLKAEIENWCALAAGGKESLVVTMGHVNDYNLSASTGPSSSVGIF